MGLNDKWIPRKLNNEENIDLSRIRNLIFKDTVDAVPENLEPPCAVADNILTITQQVYARPDRHDARLLGPDRLKSRENTKRRQS